MRLYESEGRTKAMLQTKRAQSAVLGRLEKMTPEARSKGVAGNAKCAVPNEKKRRALSMAQMMQMAVRNIRI